MNMPSTAPNLSTGTPVTSSDTAAGPRDEVAAATPDGAGSRGGETTNKYKAEVNRLLDAYEAKQAKKAEEERSKPAPEPEPEGLREGESWDSVFSSQPPEVQRAMAEMRRMMTRKTQELAQERKSLQAQQEALASSGLLDSLAKQAGNMPKDFDPFNPDHIKAAIDAKVAEQLKAVLEPINTQQKTREAVTRFESFKAEHPDLLTDPTIKAEVHSALLADKNLSLEAAYWMVKGKSLHRQSVEKKAKDEIVKRAQQRAAVIGDRGAKPGRQVITPDMKSGSAWEIYNQLKNAKG